MNPDYGEDSAKVIGSSVEEEGEAEDGGKAEAPQDGATTCDRPDCRRRRSSRD